MKNPVILASEPYTNTNNVIPNVHKDLIPYYCNDSVIKSRAAILVHKSINNSCWEIHQFTTPDLIAIKYRHDGREVILASMYMDYNENINLPKLANLIKYAEKHKLPLLLGADTNSHHKLWGNKDNNARGGF